MIYTIAKIIFIGASLFILVAVITVVGLIVRELVKLWKRRKRR